jgi:hypothetical protein
MLHVLSLLTQCANQHNKHRPQCQRLASYPSTFELHCQGVMSVLHGVIMLPVSTGLEIEKNYHYDTSSLRNDIGLLFKPSQSKPVLYKRQKI